MFPLFTNKQSTVSSTLNTSRWLKYVFISFAQAIFSEYDEYMWTTDRRTSKIIIQDKFVTNNINPEKIPQIIFTRGPQAISKTSLDSVVGMETINRKYEKIETELIRTSGSFSCISISPFTSEHIADFLFLSLFIFRDEFRARGIRDIQNIVLGEANPIKMYFGSTEVELYNTPINLQYNFQIEYLKNLYQEDYPLMTTIDMTISGYPEEFTDTPTYPLISGYTLPSGYPVDLDPLYKPFIVSGAENARILTDMDYTT